MDMIKAKKELERLVNIMEALRGPDGCPWDKKQDYYSLKPYIIEEAYEVVEALQNKDLDSLKEELGDLLLQVVFQAQIGRERNEFDLTEVISLISNKLIRRHPHVFADKNINNIEEVMETWQDIKKQEKKIAGQENDSSLLDDISRSQSALNQSYEMQAKAAEVGFDWEQVKDVIAKVEEELMEVKEAMANNDQEELENELGDLLFSVVNLTRFYKINPEVALLSTILKFKKRFKYIEKKILNDALDLKKLSLEELDAYWEEAKN